MDTKLLSSRGAIKNETLYRLPGVFDLTTITYFQYCGYWLVAYGRDRVRGSFCSLQVIVSGEDPSFLRCLMCLKMYVNFF